MFGCPARVGLASLGVPHDEIVNVNNEEDLEVVFREDEREVDRLNNGENGLNFQTVTEIVDQPSNSATASQEQTTFEEESSDPTDAELSSTVVTQDSLLTNVDEPASIRDTRRENILNHRKRIKECLQKQAVKMMKLSCNKFPPTEIGTIVRLPIPDVDRARGSRKNFTGTRCRCR